MNKSLYYIECVANTDLDFTNEYTGQKRLIYKKGDIVYFNPNATSKETYVGYNKKLYYARHGHIPFTREKKYAKKWQHRKYADWEANLVNNIGQFSAVVKEIKITYTEE